MMTFDLNTHIVSDFTQDKKQIQEGIDQLAKECTCRRRFPRDGRLRRAERGAGPDGAGRGQKYIFLIASGIDTMSKLDLDQIVKRVKATRDTTIFTISTGGFFETMQGGDVCAPYLQAENQMRSFFGFDRRHAL